MEEKELKELLIKWLQEDDYPLDECIRQIEEANINQKGNKVIITYSNGAVDVINLEGNKIIHLESNP